MATATLEIKDNLKPITIVNQSCSLCFLQFGVFCTDKSPGRLKSTKGVGTTEESQPVAKCGIYQAANPPPVSP